MTSKGICFLLVLAALGACTPVVANRGNFVRDEDVKATIVGFHTRADVLKNLGSPTTVAPFDENRWYYIGQETSKKGILDSKVDEEKIVIVQFDESGTVSKVEESNEGRIDVPVERAKTPTHGNSMTLMQQLLGNLGRFNPGEQ